MAQSADATCDTRSAPTPHTTIGDMPSRGFTLIEILVVLVILAITASTVAFSISGVQAREDDREVRRLRLVLESAGERAAITGTAIAAEFLPGRYRFSTLDTEGHWRPVTDSDALAEHQLPEGMGWDTLNIDGRSPNANPPLVFGAEMPRFELRLRTREGLRRYRSSPDGGVLLDTIAEISQ